MHSAIDVAASAYVPDARTDEQDLSTLSTKAAAIGYRLVPVNDEQSGAPDAHPENISGMVRRMAWLKSATESAKAQADSYGREYDQLRHLCEEQMVEEGVDRTTVDGWTAHFSPAYRLSKNREDTTTEEILAALAGSGLGSMVKKGYSYQTLQAYLKELDENGLPVPEKIAELFTLEKTHEVRLRRSGRR
jgi:hypothetical protein